MRWKVGSNHHRNPPRSEGGNGRGIDSNQFRTGSNPQNDSIGFMSAPEPDSNAPACLGPDPRPEPLAWTLPDESWDTHFHVFGPIARFPYARRRRYTPPEATFEEYRALMARTGIARAVCVHPNVHGPDNAVTLDAVRRSEGRFLGIIKLEDEADLPTLRRLHAAGVRGVRFAFHPQHGGRFDAALFDRMAERADALGWCLDLHASPDDLVRLARKLAETSVPLVIDHMGRIDPSNGTAQAPFQALLELARFPHVWVKLTGADRISRQGPPYDDVVPFARDIIRAAPDRVIWGTDWPHSGYFDPARVPNDGALINLLARIAPDRAVRRAILVDNPKRLFDGAV